MTADEQRPEDHVEKKMKESPVSDQTAGDVASGISPGSCRFFEKASGEEIPFAWIVHEIDDLEPGRVIEVHRPDGEKLFYNIDRVDEGAVPMVQLVKARNNLWKFGLLLAILAVSWYAIKFIIELF